MDFVTHLPWTSQGHDAVWVIVDRLTKSAHFLAVRMTFTLEEFYRLYIQGDCSVPWRSSIHSIRSGCHVYNSFLEEFLATHGDTVNDEHCFSSPDKRSVRDGHPDFRGHTTGVLDLKGSWEEHLPFVKFSYNNSYQVSIQMAPYDVLYGRPCQSPVCWMEVGERTSTGLDLVRDTSEKVELIRKSLLTAQSR